MLPSGVFLTQTYVHLLYSKLKRLCDNFGGVEGEVTQVLMYPK